MPGRRELGIPTKKYSSPLASRLSRNCMILAFGGPNLPMQPNVSDAHLFSLSRLTIKTSETNHSLAKKVHITTIYGG